MFLSSSKIEKRNYAKIISRIEHTIQIEGKTLLQEIVSNRWNAETFNEQMVETFYSKLKLINLNNILKASFFIPGFSLGLFLPQSNLKFKNTSKEQEFFVFSQPFILMTEISIEWILKILKKVSELNELNATEKEFLKQAESYFFQYKTGFHTGKISKSKLRLFLSLKKEIPQISSLTLDVTPKAFKGIERLFAMLIRR